MSRTFLFQSMYIGKDMKHKEILFISSESDFDFYSFFDGYAFFGIDFVIGNKGFQKFYKHNVSVDMYEDGNYVLINRVDANKYKLTRDYHGYYPLYYFNSDDYWCVSNSIIYIAEYLRSKGITINYNESNVEAWKCHLPLLQTINSHSTFIDEIKVLPGNQDIFFIKENARNSISFTKRAKSLEVDKDYNTALKNCLDIWIKRYLTILSNQNIALWNDLTGGLDSRTLFSFLIRNIDEAREAFKDRRLRISSNSKNIEDFEVAKRLASLFDFKLNTSIDEEFHSEIATPHERFAVWKYFNLGRYSPIVFSSTDFNSKWAEFGGEGGENNRNFYLSGNSETATCFNEFIEEKYKEFFISDIRYKEWVSQVRQSILLLQQDVDMSPSIIHYREFRSTHHTIKNPRSRMKIAPLGGKHFDILGRLSSKNTLKSGQILYDIIYNNCNKLLYIPYDKSYKNMSDSNIVNLPRLGLQKSNESGNIYWSGNEDKSNFLVDLPIQLNDLSYTSPLQILYDQAISSLKNNESFIEYYFGRDYIDEFYRKFDSIDFETSSIHLHKNGCFLHALILIDFISKNS